MNGQRQKPYRLGRRPGEQGPRPLSWNQDRAEKLATGTTNRTINQAITTSHAITAPKLSIPTIRNQLQAQTTTTTANSHVSNKLKLTKRIFTVGTWNVRTLWAAAKQIDNYDILGHLDSVARSVRPSQPFFSQAEYVFERKDLLKENGGPVDACWSTSFHDGLRGALALVKDKLDTLGDLGTLKYSFSSKNFVNYLSCHDNERLLHDIGKKDLDAFIRIKTAIIILLTSVGIPMIRQGDELGEDREVGNYQVQKTCFPMPWNLLENDFNIRLLNTFKHLIKLRHINKSLREDPMNFFYEDNQNRIIAYSRGKNLVVVASFNKMAKTKYIIGNFPQNGMWIDYITNEQVFVDAVNNLTLDLLPFDSRLYIKQT
ncbi:unnamed protein product [Rotaria sp. Silwood1]|nr:unnamed protein product [Rotaria sp. Silwood1]